MLMISVEGFEGKSVKMDRTTFVHNAKDLSNKPLAYVRALAQLPGDGYRDIRDAAQLEINIRECLF